MLTQNLHTIACVGGLEKEVGTGWHVSELPPAVVVPGGVGTHVHRSTYVHASTVKSRTLFICVNWKKADAAISCTRKGDSC